MALSSVSAHHISRFRANKVMIRSILPILPLLEPSFCEEASGSRYGRDWYFELRATQDGQDR
jgi:hypothetical protein